MLKPLSPLFLTLLGLVLSWGLGGAAQAQDFPSKPVRLLTPFPVGSGPDGLLRLVAEKLSQTWGKPVVVENKPGGNGFIAIEAFKRASSDGHDLIQLDSLHLSTYPHLFKKLPYDVAVDFEPLVPLFKTYFFFTVPAESPYKKVSDLIQDAKRNPGRLNYGSWSIGNPAHLGGALFESVTKTQMQHVVYKETSALYGGVATAELAFALGTNATAGGLYRAGKLNYLAVAAPKRLAMFPNVPTVAESGGPTGFEVTGWTVIASPRGLPKTITDKIQRDVEKALAEPDVREKMASFTYEPFTLTRDQLNRYIDSESRRFGSVIKNGQISLD